MDIETIGWSAWPERHLADWAADRGVHRSRTGCEGNRQNERCTRFWRSHEAGEFCWESLRAGAHADGEYRSRWLAGLFWPVVVVKHSLVRGYGGAGCGVLHLAEADAGGSAGHDVFVLYVTRCWQFYLLADCTWGACSWRNWRSLQLTQIARTRKNFSRYFPICCQILKITM